MMIICRRFFDQFNMKKPDYLLQLGGGNHGAQTGRMMQAIEEEAFKKTLKSWSFMVIPILHCRRIGGFKIAY